MGDYPAPVSMTAETAGASLFISNRKGIFVLRVRQQDVVMLHDSIAGMIYNPAHTFKNKR